MVKQRFLVLFRGWLPTVTKVFGPVLLFELFASVRHYFQYVPLSTLDLLMGLVMSVLLTAMLCALWAWGEWWWSKLRRLRGFVSELRQCSRMYWNPAPVKTKRA